MRDRVLALVGLRGEQHTGVSRGFGFRLLVLGGGPPFHGNCHAEAAQRSVERRSPGKRREVGVECRGPRGQAGKRCIDPGLPGGDRVKRVADLGQPAGATGGARDGAEVLRLVLGGAAVHGSEDERAVRADRRRRTRAGGRRPVGHGRERRIDQRGVERAVRIGGQHGGERRTLRGGRGGAQQRVECARIEQRAVGCEPGVEQACRVQRGLDARPLARAHLRTQVYRLPQRRARPAEARTARPRRCPRRLVVIVLEAPCLVLERDSLSLVRGERSLQ